MFFWWILQILGHFHNLVFFAQRFLFCVPIDLLDFLSVVEPAPEGDVCQLNQSNNQKHIIESTFYGLELCISFAPFSSFYLNRGWTE